MKRVSVLSFAILFFLSFFSYSFASQKKVVFEILDILKEKKIITEKKYKELKKRAEEEERKTYERIKKEVVSKEKKKVVCGYKDGFYLKTKDKSFKIKLIGRVNFDTKIFANKNHPERNDFYIKRARIGLSGTLFKYYDFKVETDFAGGDATLKDAYINFRGFPDYQLKVGQIKVPFSLEAVSSTKWMHFACRSMVVSNLAPARDYGFMVHGDPFSGMLHYALGIFDGTRANKGDTDDDKDFAARLVFSPFKRSKNKIIENLSIGSSLTVGHHNMTYPDDKSYFWSKGSFKTYGGTKFFQFSKGIKHAGRMERYGAELFWAYGPFSFQSEWLRTNLLSVRNEDGKSYNLYVYGGYVDVGYFVRGRRRLKKGVVAKPKLRSYFDPKSSSWGALELVGRYDYMKLDNDFFKKRFSDKNAYTDRVRSFTFGINWFLNNAALFRINYSHIDFDDYIKEAKGDDEDLILGRFQLVW